MRGLTAEGGRHEPWAPLPSLFLHNGQQVNTRAMLFSMKMLYLTISSPPPLLPLPYTGPSLKADGVEVTLNKRHHGVAGREGRLAQASHCMPTMSGPRKNLEPQWPTAALPSAPQPLGESLSRAIKSQSTAAGQDGSISHSLLILKSFPSWFLRGTQRFSSTSRGFSTASILPCAKRTLLVNAAPSAVAGIPSHRGARQDELPGSWALPHSREPGVTSLNTGVHHPVSSAPLVNSAAGGAKPRPQRHPGI